MTDFYPLLNRAIGALDRKTPEARRAVYDRARQMLVTQLRSMTPPLSEAGIRTEQSALESAIERIETEATNSRVRQSQVNEFPGTSASGIQAEENGRGPVEFVLARPAVLIAGAVAVLIASVGGYIYFNGRSHLPNASSTNTVTIDTPNKSEESVGGDMPKPSLSRQAGLCLGYSLWETLGIPNTLNEPDTGIAGCNQLIAAILSHNAPPPFDTSNVLTQSVLVNAYVTRGLYWAAKADFKDADADYDKAISYRASSGVASLNRCIFWLLRGNVDRAITDFGTIIDGGPDLFLPKDWAPGVTEAQRRATLQALQPIAERYIVLAHYLRGVTLIKKGDLDRAITDFDAVVANPVVTHDLTSPDSKKYLVYILPLRGVASLMKGNIVRARSDLMIDPIGLTTFGRINTSFNDFIAIVVDRFDTLAQRIPDATYLGRGTVEFLKGDMDHAIADLGEAERLHRNPSRPGYQSLDGADFMALYLRGIALITKGDFEHAFADFDDVVRRDPDDSGKIARPLRGLAALLRGRTDGAIIDLFFWFNESG
jgi:tetratricopeptide (TPR) repeat protein